MGACRDSGSLGDGQRIGRFVVLRDLGGQRHAIAAGSVGAVCETEDGSLLLLPGGRLVHVGQPLATVLAWLDGHGPPGRPCFRPPSEPTRSDTCLPASRQPELNERVPSIEACCRGDRAPGKTKRSFEP